MWKAIAVVVAISAACGGCTTNPQAPGGIVCTAQFVYGLSVTVKDTSTGQLLCDANVTAVSGSYRETLTMLAVPGYCSYAGAGERAGVYDVSASRAGYSPATASSVRVDADACHVIPARVTLELKP